jgi:hypothetical protein
VPWMHAVLRDCCNNNKNTPKSDGNDVSCWRTRSAPKALARDPKKRASPATSSAEDRFRQLGWGEGAARSGSVGSSGARRAGACSSSVSAPGVGQPLCDSVGHVQA